MEVYDLCIIGAGMFGSAAARHASLYPSTRVCLIGPNEPSVEERQNREIYSSHYDEGRIMLYPSSHDFNVLAKKTVDSLLDLEILSGKKIFNPLGVLSFRERNDNFYKTLEALRSSGTPIIEYDDCSFKTKFPYLNVEEKDFVVFENPKGGYISPRTCVEVQKQVAKMQGCDIIEDIVEDVKDLEDGIQMVVTESKRVIRARQILFCTGAFTPFKKFYSLLRLKIQVQKELAILLQIPKSEAERLRSMPPLGYRKKTADMPLDVFGAYVLPPIKYPDGEFYLKIGPFGGITHPEIKTLQEIKEWYNGGDNKERELLSCLPKILKKLIPNVKVEREKTVACLTCYNESGVPYIDKISPTITVAIVGNGEGASTSDEVGRLAAHLSLTGEWDSELSKSLFQAAFVED